MNMSTVTQIMALLNVGLRGLHLQRLRVVSMILGSIAVIAVMASVLSISEGYKKMSKVTSNVKGTRILMEGASSEVASSISKEEVSLIKKFEAIDQDSTGSASVSAEIFKTIKLKNRQQQDINITLRGVEAASYELSGTTIVDGRRPISGRREVIMGGTLLGRLSKVAIGDEIKISNSLWRVVGVFRSENGLSESEVWTDLGVLASVSGQVATVQTLLVKLKDGVSVREFNRALDNDPRLKVHARSQQDYVSGQSKSLMQFIAVITYSVSAMMAIGAIFASFITSYASVSSRIDDLIVITAIGFRGSAILWSIIGEGLILTLIGGALGAGIAYFVFHDMQATTTLLSNNYTAVAFSFDVSPQILFKSFLASLFIGVAGSVYPAWSITSLSNSNRGRG